MHSVGIIKIHNSVPSGCIKCGENPDYLKTISLPVALPAMTALLLSPDSWKFLHYTSCWLASDDVREFQTTWGWVRRTKIRS